MNFEEWYNSTRFAKKTFFESYLRYLRGLKLAYKPSEFMYGFQLKKIKTTPLMSRLNHTCSNELQYIDTLIINKGEVYLVIIHKLPYEFSSIADQVGSWTMTELKNSYSYTFKHMNDERGGRKIHWDENTWLNVWAIPLHVRAVTNGDKDFRKEYEWGELVYEGNQYGDTSDFYIIGTLISKKAK